MLAASPGGTCLSLRLAMGEPGLDRMFAKLSVAFRVYGAFGTLIVLLCLVGLAGAFGLQSVANSFNEYRTLARQTLEINEYAADLATARRISLAYRIDPTDALAQDLIAMIDDVATYDENGLAIFEGDEVALEGLMGAQELAYQFKATAETMIEAQNTMNVMVRVAASRELDAIA